MRILAALLIATLAHASDYTEALAAWLHVEPITPHIEWYADQAALLKLNRPGYTSAMGWMYQADTKTIYAFHCGNDAASMRHEIFHATAHARLPRIPLWLNEGTAQLMERIRINDGVIEFTTHNRIRTAARAEVSLLKVVAYDSADFGGKDSTTVYASAYAVVLWMHQTGTLQTWLHGDTVPLDPDVYHKWLIDPAAWP